jgi:hypothetical protein
MSATRPVVKAFDDITSQAAAPAISIEDADVKNDKATVQVWGTFTATVKVEGSQDGTNWTQIGSDLTAPGFVDVDKKVKFVRTRASAYTSGTVESSVMYGERVSKL